MGASRTDHPATVEQKEGGPEPPGALRGVLRHALNNVLAQIRKLEAEAILGHQQSTPEDDPLGRLRPELLQEPAMPPYHLILRGAGVEGAVLMEVQDHPFDTAKSHIGYQEYVQHSQEKYGQTIQTSLPTSPPPEEEDEYRITRKE